MKSKQCLNLGDIRDLAHKYGVGQEEMLLNLLTSDLEDRFELSHVGSLIAAQQFSDFAFVDVLWGKETIYWLLLLSDGRVRKSK